MSEGCLMKKREEQCFLRKPIMVPLRTGVARIFDWGGGQTTNHIGEDQGKKVFTVRFKFSWRLIWDWGKAKLNLLSEDQNKNSM